MSLIGHYLQLHIAAAAGGIDLFSRGAQQPDPETRAGLDRIRAELIDERVQLRRMATDLGEPDSPFPSLAARAAERIGRLKPNGKLFSRTPLTDLVDLETMRDAVSGKIAGWEALLVVAGEHDGLREDELNALLAQAKRQLEDLRAFHERAAGKALAVA